MAFIGAAIAMLIGILIFSEISESIDCMGIDDNFIEECENAKDTAWTVIGIMPVVLFFAIFAIMGGMGGLGSISLPKRPSLTRGSRTHNKITIIQKLMITLGLAKVRKLE